MPMVFRPIHRWFGLAGLIPFILLPLISPFAELPLQQWQLSYAALIFSFLGGIIWLGSLHKQSTWHISWVSILVMLWAWSWLLLDSLSVPFASESGINHIGVLLAGLSFPALLVYEICFLKQIYPSDFMRLRVLLTAVASSSLLLSFFFI